MSMYAVGIMPLIHESQPTGTKQVWPYGRTQLVTFLSHLNGLCEKIQFTMEIEEENQLPFLDVSVKTNENTLTTSVFRKKTHTDRYLHFRSHHHSQIKTSVVSCLNSRAERVCAVPQPIGLTSRLATYRRHEQEKRRAYEQRVREVKRASFTPLLFAASGGVGKLRQPLLSAEVTPALQHNNGVASLRLSFALLRSAVLSPKSHKILLLTQVS